ncbi:hypothetical protein AXF42_Ash020072 [Apostasia shenzhenica]|uniref:Uncharacterized protein n=1 Tax=Apostasia shenzhenica TaxID=1088818 RepID=A0A2I0B4T6_9ASPA|nr:hypothetical protein AXF42_Ash020072 [Apostasia shenzhenica]
MIKSSSEKHDGTSSHFVEIFPDFVTTSNTNLHSTTNTPQAKVVDSIEPVATPRCLGSFSVIFAASSPAGRLPPPWLPLRQEKYQRRGFRCRGSTCCRRGNGRRAIPVAAASTGLLFPLSLGICCSRHREGYQEGRSKNCSNLCHTQRILLCLELLSTNSQKALGCTCLPNDWESRIYPASRGIVISVTERLKEAAAFLLSVF